MGKLDGKVALVTGAGRGIGRGIARGLATEGASLVLAARSDQQLRAAAEELTASGATVLAIPTDVADEKRVQDLFRATMERFHRLDFGHMEVQLTIDDPETYTRPFTIKLKQRLLPDTDLLESFCAENEKDASHIERR